MKKLNSLFVAFAIISLAIIGQARADEASDIFALQKSDKIDLTAPTGYWSLPDQTQNGFIFSLRFKLALTEMTVANRCTYRGQVAYVAASAPVTLTADTLQINGSARNSVNVGGLNCNVSIDAGAPQRYRVVNGVMSLEGVPVTAEKLQDLQK